MRLQFEVLQVPLPLVSVEIVAVRVGIMDNFMQITKGRVSRSGNAPATVILADDDGDNRRKSVLVKASLTSETCDT